jgi:hypothetical protein
MGIVTLWLLAALIVSHGLALIYVIVCLRRLRREIGFLRVTMLETLIGELKARAPRHDAEQS